MKKCSKCKSLLEIEEFYTNNAKKDKLSSECRECNRIKSKDYYYKNKDKFREGNLKRYKANREKYIEYFREHSCIDCGETDIIVLQADHQYDKTYAVSRMIAGYSWARILQELEKCEIVCSNCHLKRTAKTQGWYKSL